MVTACVTVFSLCFLPFLAVAILSMIPPGNPAGAPGRLPQTGSLLDVFASIACCAPVLGAFALWIWLAVDRVWAGIKARECDYICCGNCLQDLRGLAEMGQCPECGEPYSAPVLIAGWKEIDGVPEIET